MQICMYNLAIGKLWQIVKGFNRSLFIYSSSLLLDTQNEILEAIIRDRTEMRTQITMMDVTHESTIQSINSILMVTPDTQKSTTRDSQAIREANRMTYKNSPTIIMIAGMVTKIPLCLRVPATLAVIMREGAVTTPRMMQPGSDGGHPFS